MAQFFFQRYNFPEGSKEERDFNCLIIAAEKLFLTLEIDFVEIVCFDDDKLLNIFFSALLKRRSRLR